nr:PREDICTED: uncharacterized protein LOC106705245 [Latimeria chalumnae]|eukprot:XP_014349583.1 PREDICTED: uncharacterized protein LOC106705245 [Latimeria chalumnae]
MFLHEWIPSLKLEFEKEGLFIERMYRNPITKALNKEVRSTVIVKTVSKQVRDWILTVVQKTKTLMYQQKRILILPVLCPETQRKRRDLLEAKKKYEDMNIKASLLYPVKRHIEYGDNTYIFWDIIEEQQFIMGKKMSHFC